LALEGIDGAARDALRVTAVVVVDAGFPVRRLQRQDVVGGDEERVRRNSWLLRLQAEKPRAAKNS